MQEKPLRPKTIFLHAGLHKTGTSAIQRALLRNAGNLCQNGILFPQTGRRKKAHHELAWSIRKHKQLRGLWSELRREIDEHTGPYVLLTSESFDSFRNSGWREVSNYLNGYEVKVILYLRRQDSMILSHYNQIIKGGRTLDFATFREYISPKLDYCPLLSSIEHTFGLDSLILRVYEEATRGCGLLSDFFSILPKDCTQYDIDNSLHHISLDARYLDIMLQINRQSLTRDTRLKLLRILLENPPPDRFVGESPLMSDHERLQFMRRYERSNEDIARRYLGRKDGQLFRTPSAGLQSLKA